MLLNNVEKLKNMSASTGMFAIRNVLVIDSTLNDYAFSSRGEKTDAQQNECVLVSMDPSQYMMGIAPSKFKNRHAASNSENMLRRNSVLEVTTPAFDAKARSEYNGCRLKAVRLLKPPLHWKRSRPRARMLTLTLLTGYRLRLTSRAS